MKKIVSLLFLYFVVNLVIFIYFGVLPIFGDDQPDENELYLDVVISDIPARHPKNDKLDTLDQTPGQPLAPFTMEPASNHESDQIKEAIGQVHHLLQQQDFDMEPVNVVSLTKMEWADTCLGLPAEDEACLPRLIPGYQIVVEANGQQYSYHLDEAAKHLRSSTTLPTSSGRPILIWEQNIGRCEAVTIGHQGIAFGECDAMRMTVPAVLENRRQDLEYFVQSYTSFTAETPAGKIIFNGQGDTHPTAAEQRMLAEWARVVRLEAEFWNYDLPLGIVLTWQRQFPHQPDLCRWLQVEVFGLAYGGVAPCEGGQVRILERTWLTEAQLETLYYWVDTFDSFEVTTSMIDDQEMLAGLRFAGLGQNDPTETEQQALLTLSRELFAQLEMNTELAGALDTTCQTLREATAHLLGIEATGTTFVSDHQNVILSDTHCRLTFISDKVEVKDFSTIANNVRAELEIQGWQLDATSSSSGLTEIRQIFTKDDRFGQLKVGWQQNSDPNCTIRQSVTICDVEPGLQLSIDFNVILAVAINESF